jgi:deoxyribodipyrimidine photo-lyase
MIEAERIKTLNDRPVNPDGRYVLYWMQQSQRAEFNHALEHAARLANDQEQGLVVGFGLTTDYPDANERHFAFMLEGLADVDAALARRDICFVVYEDSPDEVALSLSGRASIVVCDRGYLRLQRQWRDRVASEAECCVIQVESDVVVPVETASDKREYAARTLRPKLNRHKLAFLSGLGKTPIKCSTISLAFDGEIDEIANTDTVLAGLDIDRDVCRVRRLRGGTREARRRLGGFLRNGIRGYAEHRNDPAQQVTAMLSPYLHFGQISPVEIVRKVKDAASASAEDQAAFLEELIVRRELAMNYVTFERDYNSYQGLPDWARQTLAAHRNDDRPVRYTRPQLEAAETDDPVWNAAMREMRETGYMHGYMRMYWGKKILEWSNTPEFAFRTAIYLNNKYFIDGRDPNSYANVAWLFGLHDRPWQERDIYGKVRSMTASGLRRKFDVNRYMARVDELVGQEERWTY